MFGAGIVRVDPASMNMISRERSIAVAALRSVKERYRRCHRVVVFGMREPASMYSSGMAGFQGGNGGWARCANGIGSRLVLFPWSCRAGWVALDAWLEATMGLCSVGLVHSCGNAGLP